MSRDAHHDKRLFSYIETFVSNSKNRLDPFITQGELNKEYIRGNQHKKIDPTSLRIVQKKYRPNFYKEKKVFNKMLPIYLARQGILANNRPIPGFKPDHNYAYSMDASIIGNRFIREFSKEENIGEIYNKIIMYADIYALVWIKTGIDWSKGDQVLNVDTTIKDPKTGENTKVKNKIFEGRPFIDVCTIHEIFPSTLRGEGANDIPALVHRRPLTLKQIKTRWGVDVESESVVFPDDSVLKQNTTPIRKDEEYAYLYEYYENPSAKRPKGRYVVAVRNQILVDKDLPYENARSQKRRIPFDLYNLQSIPGIIPGITAYQQLVDPQDTYNSIKNRVLEYINHMAIGQMYEYADSLVNPDAWTNTPGERILLKRHAKMPQPVRKERMGNELSGYARMVEEDMLTTAGLSPLTAFGQSKSNMRSDGVVDAVSEADQNKLTIALQKVSDTMVEVFKKILYLEKQRQRILIEDLGLAPKDDFVVKYKLDNVDPEELIIVNREFLMQSDVAIEKKVTQATNFGLYDPQSRLKYRSKLEFLETLNSGYLQDTLDPVERVNYNRIKREHSKLYAGNEIKVDPMEFHEMHIDEHTMELLSPELAELEDSDDKKYKAIKEALQLHIEEHRKFVQETSVDEDYKNAKAFE